MKMEMTEETEKPQTRTTTIGGGKTITKRK